MPQGLELGSDVVLITVAEQGPPGSGGGGGGGDGHTIQEDGSDLTARGNLNFSTGTVATDNPGDNSTDITVTTTSIGAIPLAQKAAASGVASLDSGGKVPQAQLPAIAITTVYVVASEAAMLALSADPGDVAVRTDTTETYILVTSPASTLANWQEITTPGQVSSVNGQIGAVTLDAADVGAVDTGMVGAPNGVAGLDGSGDVPDGQIASTIARTATTIASTLADAAGDMVIASAADTFTKLVGPTADGQVLRRSSSIVGWGAVDLADSDAVTGVLPTGNIATTLTGKTIALGSNTISGTTSQFNTALTDGDFVTLAGSEVLTNKTLTTPTIGSFTNATHTHANAAGGGTIPATSVTVADAGGHYTQVETEAVLDEIGDTLADLDAVGILGAPVDDADLEIGRGYMYDGTNLVAVSFPVQVISDLGKTLTDSASQQTILNATWTAPVLAINDMLIVDYGISIVNAIGSTVTMAVCVTIAGTDVMELTTGTMANGYIGAVRGRIRIMVRTLGVPGSVVGDHVMTRTATLSATTTEFLQNTADPSSGIAVTTTGPPTIDVQATKSSNNAAYDATSTAIDVQYIRRAVT